MNILLLKATEADVEALILIQKKAFERLYRIYQDEGSPYLRGRKKSFNGYPVTIGVYLRY